MQMSSEWFGDGPFSSDDECGSDSGPSSPATPLRSTSITQRPLNTRSTTTSPAITLARGQQGTNDSSRAITGVAESTGDLSSFATSASASAQLRTEPAIPQRLVESGDADWLAGGVVGVSIFAGRAGVSGTESARAASAAEASPLSILAYGPSGVMSPRQAILTSVRRTISSATAAALGLSSDEVAEASSAAANAVAGSGSSSGVRSLGGSGQSDFSATGHWSPKAARGAAAASASAAIWSNAESLPEAGSSSNEGAVEREGLVGAGHSLPSSFHSLALECSSSPMRCRGPDSWQPTITPGHAQLSSRSLFRGEESAPRRDDHPTGIRPTAPQSGQNDPKQKSCTESKAGDRSETRQEASAERRVERRAEWAALPAPALLLIGERLDLGGLLAGRLVCQNWRHLLTEAVTQLSPGSFAVHQSPPPRQLEPASAELCSPTAHSTPLSPGFGRAAVLANPGADKGISAGFDARPSTSFGAGSSEGDGAEEAPEAAAGSYGEDYCLPLRPGQLLRTVPSMRLLPPAERRRMLSGRPTRLSPRTPSPPASPSADDSSEPTSPTSLRVSEEAIGSSSSAGTPGAPVRDSVLGFLRREATKSGEQDKGELLSRLLGSFLEKPRLAAYMERQTLGRILRWERHLGQLLAGTPFLAHLDLSGSCLLAASADLSLARPAAAHWLHAAVVQDTLPLDVTTLLECWEALPHLQSARLKLFKVNSESIPRVVAGFIHGGGPEPDLALSFAVAGDSGNSGSSSAASSSGGRARGPAWRAGHGPEPLEDMDVIALACVPSITELDLSGHPALTDVAFAALGAMPALRRLNAARTGLGDCGLVVLSDSSSLCSLDISRCRNLSDVGHCAVSDIRGLRSLRAANSLGLNDVGLMMMLDGLTQLRELDLSECLYISDLGLSNLTRVSGLTRLDLSLCREVTSAGLRVVAGLGSLSELDLTFCVGIADTGFPELTRLTGLRRLTLACCQVGNSGLAAVAALGHLTHLDLKGCSGPADQQLDVSLLAGLSALEVLNLAFCEHITEAGLGALAGLTGLRDLNLAFCRGLTSGDLRGLSRLTALTSLNLHGSRTRDARVGPGLAVLALLTRLQVLNLSSCSLASECLQQLGELTSLTDLNIKYCRAPGMPEGYSVLSRLVNLTSLNVGGCRGLGDSALRSLSRLSGLIELDLSFNEPITDAGLVGGVTRLTRLRSLNLSGCRGISEGSIDCLLAALPGLRDICTAFCPRSSRRQAFPFSFASGAAIRARFNL